jgi:hypothetical protein
MGFLTIKRWYFFIHLFLSIVKNKPAMQLLKPVHVFWLLLPLSFCACKQSSILKATGHLYYINQTGNDSADGSKAAPWKTISRLNNAKLQSGDTAFFNGGQTFNGSIFIDTVTAAAANPVVITSYGNGAAIINGGDSSAITLYKSAYIYLYNLKCAGNGRKTGNVKDGIVINTCNNIHIDSIDIAGFQKAGLLIYASSFVEVNNVKVHENGFAGISLTGDYGKHNCCNIHINKCSAENNPGDPTNLTNHSGNGIIAGYCKNILIENSTATNNGWDMPRTGNGPVGIWCFVADSVIIQHCISYANKTSKGGGDGGGYDLDGGVTNSVIQYCLSYQNQGSGFGIFQYAGAGNWHNNVIRFNISEEDGAVSPAKAGIFIWNSSRDTSQFKNCLFYNNAIYNSGFAAIRYDKESEHTGFKFYDNIFVANNELITGKPGNDVFMGNDWWSLQSIFNIAGITNFYAWANINNQEQINGQVIGFNTKPAFINAGNTAITLPGQMNTFNNYQLPAGDPLRIKGLNLQVLFGINNGGKAFNENSVPVNGIGPCF